MARGNVDVDAISNAVEAKTAYCLCVFSRYLMDDQLMFCEVRGAGAPATYQKTVNTVVK